MEILEGVLRKGPDESECLGEVEGRCEGQRMLYGDGSRRIWANMELATAATNNRPERRDDGLRTDRHANRTRGTIPSKHWIHETYILTSNRAA